MAHTHPPRVRTRFRSLAVLLTVATALLATTVGVADAQPRRDAEVKPVPVVEDLRFGCQADTIGDQRGVLCRWSKAQNENTRAYQLYRIVDGSARQLIATVPADGRRAHLDTDVSAPSTLIYGVVAVNRSGRVIGIGGPDRIELGHAVEELRFGCARDSLQGQRGVLCRWSETTQSNARGYLLYRTVDRGQRELIASIGVEGRNGFFDTEIVPGSVHTYAVVAVDGSGTVIATGGPRRISWPAG